MIEFCDISSYLMVIIPVCLIVISSPTVLQRAHSSYFLTIDTIESAIFSASSMVLSFPKETLIVPFA